jgi:hypothetical protein
MEILNHINDIVSDEMTSSLDDISILHKEFYGIQNKTLTKMDKYSVCYGDYITTESANLLFNVSGDNLLKGNIKIKKKFSFYKNNGITYKNNSIVFKNFRLSSIKGIEYININIGHNRLDSIPIDIFDTMCHIYSISKNSDDGYINIPAYVFIAGYPELEHHQIDFELIFNKEYSSKTSINDLGKFSFRYDIYSSLIKENERYEFLTYQISTCHTYNNTGKSSSIFFNHPVFYLFIKDLSLKTLKLKFNDKFILNIERKSLIGEYSVFSFVENLKDDGHSINFSRIDKSEILSDIKIDEIYSVCSQIPTYCNGMSSIKYSK